MPKEKVSPSCGNVYEDLGFDDAGEMLVKAKLAAAIQDLLAAKGLTQTQAAEIIGLPQPKLSRLLNGQFRGVSEIKLLDCIARLGLEVRIVIGPELPPARPAGSPRVEVVY